MKQLVLVRHGKSSWENDLPDNKRPLKKRAINDAKHVISAFEKFYMPPATFWTSPAVRAHETAKMFKEGLKVADENFEVKNELYTFDDSALLRKIRSCPDSIDKLVVFGHNPAMTSLVNRLGDKPLDNLPTTGLCVIDFEVDHWKEIEQGRTLVTLLPKNLR
ncbi:SixA phosphatase family protein [Salegentibacter chungangensis]|uniref:SixA phosphatase family protein n=1 Tax=Salegentibacter chungangensis TaxID=1335724 RepID=A0ABW3NQI7_9FLAO